DTLLWILPAALLFVLVGVWTANLSVFSGGGSVWLGRIFAGFLVYVIYINIRRLVQGPRQLKPDNARLPAPAGGLAVGTAMGFSSGLLGIGGGGIAVPLQQILLKLPLRTCIANSSAIICISASVGAIYKTLTLPQHQDSPITGLLIGALLAPTAAIGGRLGATLTHRLPDRSVRIAFVCLMIVGAWKMAALPLPF
ncbi:MAG TPA: sulfite exporter TauE/SafE family protein, partial [Gammaproteobacteria bacterium]|nr:sulfite exporter TauE/SafE family protein [Gammaproteobacteria bacterium]